MTNQQADEHKTPKVGRLPRHCGLTGNQTQKNNTLLIDNKTDRLTYTSQLSESNQHGQVIARHTQKHPKTKKPPN